MFFILGIVFYFLVLAFIGYLSSRKVRTMDDYLVAGRKLPYYLAIPTIVATWFGAGTSMGVSGTVYSDGIYGVIADPFGCALALLLAGLFFAAPFRRLRLLTISDLLGKTYGSKFELVSTFFVLPFYVGTLASQMLAMGYVFQIVIGSSFEFGACLGAFIVLVYTVTGGMWAVTLTDFIQFGLMALGLFIILFVCLDQTQNYTELSSSFVHELSSLLPKKSASSHDWLSYTGRILMTGLGAIMGQDLIQRFLASKSESVARYSGIIGAFIYLILGMIPIVIGLAGRKIFPDLDQPEHLIPLLAKQYLSPLLFTVFACGLFSAIMSTADSYLLAGTTLITNNIILKICPISNEKRKIAIIRLVNIYIAIFAFAIAFSKQSIFNLMVHSGTTLFVAIFVPATAALFWKKANATSAWASMIMGIFSWLACLSYYYFNNAIFHEDHLFSAATFGALFSFGTYFGVAFATMKLKKISPLFTIDDQNIYGILKN